VQPWEPDGERLAALLRDETGGGTLLLYLPTTRHLPERLIQLKGQLLARMAAGTLPVLVLGPEAGEDPEQADRWHDYAIKFSQPQFPGPFRQGQRRDEPVPGFPVIDLLAVPAFYRRLGLPLPPDGEERRKRLALGLEAGLRQLDGRLSSAGARRPPPAGGPR
jgi:hypothetical protein